jgi:hypothetical protein
MACSSKFCKLLNRRIGFFIKKHYDIELFVKLIDLILFEITVDGIAALFRFVPRWVLVHFGVISEAK